MASMGNKELVRTFVDKAFVQHDLDGAFEFISEDYMLHDSTHPDFPGGRAAFKEMLRECMESGVQNPSFTIDDQFAEDDRVVTRWTSSGCQTKDLPGIPSKGKCFNVSGITISRVSDGKIAEDWVTMDELGLQRQLGSA